MKVKYSEYFKPGDLVKRAITGIVKEGVKAFPVYICDVVCGFPIQVDLDWHVPVLSKRKEWGGGWTYPCKINPPCFTKFRIPSVFPGRIETTKDKIRSHR